MSDDGWEVVGYFKSSEPRLGCYDMKELKPETETISLAEAVAIWLETGVWPELFAPSLCQGRESWNKPGACSFEKIDKDGYKQLATFHKDQRFVKPVKRETARQELERFTNGPIRLNELLTLFADRIDELEKKVK